MEACLTFVIIWFWTSGKWRLQIVEVSVRVVVVNLWKFLMENWDSIIAINAILKNLLLMNLLVCESCSLQNV